MTESAYAKSKSSQEPEVVYVADNQRDAELLQFQTGAPVKVRRRLIDTILFGSSDLYVTRGVVKKDARDVSDQ